MTILVVGGSRGLGKALVEGLLGEGKNVVAVARSAPSASGLEQSSQLSWIEADLSNPRVAADVIVQSCPEQLDAIIYNVGIWETNAFEDNYDFLQDTDDEIVNLVNVNVIALILLLKRLLPRVLLAPKPQIILAGSTSALPNCGSPEVTFGATKCALNGIAEALREGYRSQGLAVTCLQLGYLNTGDWADDENIENTNSLIPLQDVVAMVCAVLNLSEASYIRTLVMPARMDGRF
ncbi:SDR family oxidoreductase [Marinimicrobium sp. ABcell2]|uniref:SDR family NAD(P)-dependent oxidoreductase n=1 Tax=Marinimicrobium sp. ABcell2 TaxID=3069751 RepID=UPI0027B403EA|nr:SDR family oxidoreductase [Marinimicrobium sp. ABcell2]MDQ2077124.1 SDR family oxidoreductase [Marinimicrobium sp. ABcell2]